MTFEEAERRLLRYALFISQRPCEEGFLLEALGIESSPVATLDLNSEPPRLVVTRDPICTRDPIWRVVFMLLVVSGLEEEGFEVVLPE